MGAQESKSEDGLINDQDGLQETVLEYIQQNDKNEREDEERRRLEKHEQQFINELHEETVIPEQSHTLVLKNKMDSHNLISSELNENSKTLAELNIQGTEEAEQEIDCSLVNLGSVINKSKDKESEELLKKLDLELNNCGEYLYCNKSVVLYKVGPSVNTCASALELGNQGVHDKISNLEANSTAPDDPVIKIKRELLTEEYANLQIEDPDREINGDLEVIKGSSLDIIPFTSNSIGVDHDLLAENLFLNEDPNLIQNLEINTELLSPLANELENTEEQLLLDRNVSEILITTSPFIAENGNSITDDLVINERPQEINYQDWPAENLNIRAIEIFQPQNNQAPDLGNIEKPSNEIKENEILTNTEKGSANVTKAKELKIIDENINKDILNIEETAKQIKTEQIELANINETPKTPENYCDFENKDIIEKGLSPENLNIRAIEIFQPKNIPAPDLVNIEKPSNEIKENEILTNTEKGSANVVDVKKLKIIDENINKDILNIEETTKQIKIEQIELANNNETPKTPETYGDFENIDIFEKILSPGTPVLDENIPEDILNIEVTTKQIKIELDVEENSNTNGRNETNEVSAALNANKEGFKDISNIEISNTNIKIEQIELGNIETFKPPNKELAVEGYNENLNINEKVLSPKNTISDKTITDEDPLSIEATKKNIKIEQIELAQNDTSKINENEKEITIELNENNTEDCLSIDNSPNKIKTEPIELDINENSSNNKKANDQENLNINQKQVSLPPKSPLIENLNEQPFTQIKIEPLIIDADENPDNTLLDTHKESSDDDCIILSINKEWQTNTKLSSKPILNESDKPLIIENLCKEIKIESSKVDVKENLRTSGKAATHYEQIIQYNFVKNPFAFLKNLYKPLEKPQKNIGNIQLTEKFVSTNISTTAEIIIDDSDDELEIIATSTVVVKEENLPDVYEKILDTNKDIPIKTEQTNKLTDKTDDDLVTKNNELHFNNNSNWNDVTIKREQIEECLENISDKNEDILNASLDVNVNNSLTSDVDDTFFSESANDLLSNSTRIVSTPSSEYYSIIDLSSLDDSASKSNEVATTELNKEPEIKTKFRGRPKGRRDLKPRKHRLTAREAIEKAKSSSYSSYKKAKRKYTKKKPQKSQKYTEKDSPFNLKQFCKKNLPKTHIVTRTKETTQVSNSQEKLSVNGDFPKPFKLEMASNGEKNIAKELPKPIVYKTELPCGMPAYKMREFQPRVLLKRLKSPELLVPLKIRKISNRSRKPFVTKSTSQQPTTTSKDQQNLQIQQAYSLNPRNKFHRWSLESESESKYFTQQELSTIFCSSTPGSSSRYGGPFMSARVSTSTPILNPQRHQNQEQNKTLLLEIAAERAFINNHLLHFGFSPVHFELFNDVNDLNVFLKYLFGHSNSL